MLKRYDRKGFMYAEPYTLGMHIDDVSISGQDLLDGSPKIGDMIATNPDNPNDRWLISKALFEKGYEQEGKEIKE